MRITNLDERKNYINREYVSIEDLRSEMYEAAFEEDSGLQKWDGGCWIRYKLFENVLEKLPTVKVGPPRSGKWIKVGGYFTPGGDAVWKCSECGKGVHVYGVEAASYNAEVADGQWVACPNCGARMDEVTE